MAEEKQAVRKPGHAVVGKLLVDEVHGEVLECLEVERARLHGAGVAHQPQLQQERDGVGGLVHGERAARSASVVRVQQSGLPSSQGIYCSSTAAIKSSRGAKCHSKQRTKSQIKSFIEDRVTVTSFGHIHAFPYWCKVSPTFLTDVSFCNPLAMWQAEALAL